MKGQGTNFGFPFPTSCTHSAQTTPSGRLDAVMGPIVVIAASLGGLGPVLRVAAALPAHCTASVFFVWHIGDNASQLPDILNKAGSLPATFAGDGMAIEPGRIYMAPRDRHMLLDADRIRLSGAPKVHHARPAADPLFTSAAAAFGKRVVGIVLSGGGGDGALGLKTIKGLGGLAFVQHPKHAEMASMPLAAIAAGHPSACLSDAASPNRSRGNQVPITLSVSETRDRSQYITGFHFSNSTKS